MFRIKTLNNISPRGLERFPRDLYDVGPDSDPADALMVRSADLHKVEIGESVLAIGRAGAGTSRLK